jgi:hypothetical protein
LLALFAARKSPALDGKVQRDKEGKEVSDMCRKCRVVIVSSNMSVLWVLKLLVFGNCDNSVREQDWHCRKRAGVTRARQRQRQSFERMHTLCFRIFSREGTPALQSCP